MSYINYIMLYIFLFTPVLDCLNILFYQGHGTVITAYFRESTLNSFSQVTKNVILLCMHILISYSHRLQLQIVLLWWMPDQHILRWFSAFNLLIQDLTQFRCDRYTIVAQTSHTYVQLYQTWRSALWHTPNLWAMLVRVLPIPLQCCNCRL